MRRSRLGIFSLSYIELFDFLVEFLLFRAIQKHTIGYNHAKTHQANASTCREHKRNDVELSSHARYVYYESKSVGFVQHSMLRIVLHKFRGKSSNKENSFSIGLKISFLYSFALSLPEVKTRCRVCVFGIEASETIYGQTVLVEIEITVPNDFNKNYAAL